MNPTSTQLLLLGALASASLSFGDTPLLENPDFSVLEGPDVGWVAGSNSFIGGVWQSFILDGYTLDDRVDPSGEGFVFTSWDDEVSDTLENFLYQQFGAGPAGSGTESEFSTGDVIVFSGSASATRDGADTSDMIVRAFIKTLGYNEQGWAFQTKPEYTEFHDIGSELTSFELRVTFPDLGVDDSLQVLQVGFEITNSFDGTAMDSGSIYFENLSAYIEGDGSNVEFWHGFEVLADSGGWVNTGTENLGWVFTANDPYMFSDSLQSWFFLPTGDDLSGPGSWLYVYDNASSE